MLNLVRYTGFLSALAWSVISTGNAIAQTTKSPLAAYMLLGPDGAHIARVVTEVKDCPALFVDGHVVEMQVRSPAGTAPERPAGQKGYESKPAAFPATTCEATIPQTAKQVSVHGWLLPLPPKTIRRIVVIGDTGCRIPAHAGTVQDCNDAKAYPFAIVAAAAAAWKPDIVLHVGDYLYRENPCPDGVASCAGGPWGYGLDAWRADFFDPAAALLKAAPWVMVRGNHESCDRAGQGWRRFFDPYPLTAERSCDDPANDAAGDFTEPFAVPLGQGAQIVVWDTGSAGNTPFPQNDPRRATYLANIQRIFALAKNQPHTILANHHPVLAVAAFKGKDLKGGLGPSNGSLADVLVKAEPNLYPAGIDLLLSGHIHVWEQLSFGGRFPSQFVAGFSGTQEDTVPLPETLPQGLVPVPGATPDAFSSWIDGFGFMTLQRIGAANWDAEVHDKTGKVVDRCTIRGRISKCKIRQVHIS